MMLNGIVTMLIAAPVPSATSAVSTKSWFEGEMAELHICSSSTSVWNNKLEIGPNFGEQALINHLHAVDTMR